MNVLFVCSGNFKGRFEHAQVFVHEQMESLKRVGVTCDLFLISGKGTFGYALNALRIRKLVKRNHYDLVHAVYGLSGMASILQRRVPVITTFIGSDVNIKKSIIPELVARFSKHCIFVEEKMTHRVAAKKNYSVVPFGINLDIFEPHDQLMSRNIMGLDPIEKIILFSSTFSRAEKNFSLAKAAVDLLPFPVKIIELGQSYSRQELAYLFNAADLFLMTSLHEGSPQTIKEAMACNCPIVSTDVGDVKSIIEKMAGCYITTYEPGDVAAKITLAFNYGEKTIGRERITHLGLETTAEKILSIYHKATKSQHE